MTIATGHVGDTAPQLLRANLYQLPAPETATGTQTDAQLHPARDGSTTAGEHGSWGASVVVDWNNGNAFIEAGNHTLRVTLTTA